MDSQEIEVATVTETSRATACGKSGFTLVEVIISSMIFFIVSVGFTAGMLAALKTHSMAAQHYRGTCLARNQVQHARTLAFDAIRQLQTNIWVDEQGERVADTNDGVFYQCTTVTNPPGMTNTVEIMVQVYFPQPFGKMSQQPVELRTMVSKVK